MADKRSTDTILVVLVILGGVAYTYYEPAMAWAFGKKEWFIYHGDELAGSMSFPTKAECDARRLLAIEGVKQQMPGDLATLQIALDVKCKSRRL